MLQLTVKEMMKWVSGQAVLALMMAQSARLEVGRQQTISAPSCGWHCWGQA